MIKNVCRACPVLLSIALISTVAGLLTAQNREARKRLLCESLKGAGKVLAGGASDSQALLRRRA